MESADQVREALNRMHEAVWELTAVSLALGDAAAADPTQQAEARHVVTELGLMEPGQDGPQPSPALAALLVDGAANLASEAAGPVLQCAALLTGTASWNTQDDAALVAQARASARAAAPFREFVVPMLEGLADLLAGPSPVMLDVGVGLGAMAVEYCRIFPGLHVVGIDVFPRALELATTVVADAEMADRVELRHQDVSDLDDHTVYTLAWLPAPFVPPAAVEAGVPRMAEALVPGGWLVLGHGKFGGDPLSAAVTRLKTTVYGGTPLTDTDAQNLLANAGLDRVRTLPTPTGAPGLSVGRRPPDRA